MKNYFDSLMTSLQNCLLFYLIISLKSIKCHKSDQYSLSLKAHSQIRSYHLDQSGPFLLSLHGILYRPQYGSSCGPHPAHWSRLSVQVYTCSRKDRSLGQSGLNEFSEVCQ